MGEIVTTPSIQINFLFKKKNWLIYNYPNYQILDLSTNEFLFEFL
jgi:hypothetical protein